MFNINFLMYLGIGLGIFTATGILIAGVSYLIQFIQHYRRLRVFVDEVEQEKLEREYEMRDEVYPDEEEHSSPG